MGRHNAKGGGYYRRPRYGHQARRRDRTESAAFAAWLASPSGQPDGPGGTETATTDTEVAGRAEALEPPGRSGPGPVVASGDRGESGGRP